MKLNLKPIKCQCRPHIETSQLICCTNQLTGLYMTATLAFTGLNKNYYEGFIQETNKKLYIKYRENKIKLMSVLKT